MNTNVNTATAAGTPRSRHEYPPGPHDPLATRQARLAGAVPARSVPERPAARGGGRPSGRGDGGGRRVRHRPGDVLRRTGGLGLARADGRRELAPPRPGRRRTPLRRRQGGGDALSLTNTPRGPTSEVGRLARRVVLLEGTGLRRRSHRHCSCYPCKAAGSTLAGRVTTASHAVRQCPSRACPHVRCHATLERHTFDYVRLGRVIHIRPSRVGACERVGH
jgi:hypothetical protein